MVPAASTVLVPEQERPIAEILRERSKLVLRMRLWVILGALLGGPGVIAFARAGGVGGLAASIALGLAIALLGLLLYSTAGAELSGDTVFSNSIPFRAILFGGELGAMRAKDIAGAEHLVSGEWAYVRVVPKSGEMARFVAKGDDRGVEVVLEWLRQNGIEVREDRLDPNWRGIRIRPSLRPKTPR